MVFLTNSGVASAFHRDSGKRLGVVNALPTEVVRSVYANRLREELVVVSVHSHEHYETLRARAVPVASILR